MPVAGAAGGAAGGFFSGLAAQNIIVEDKRSECSAFPVQLFQSEDCRETMTRYLMVKGLYGAAFGAAIGVLLAGR
jgi:hypothetical protein